jgi:hypothetical protein
VSEEVFSTSVVATKPRDFRCEHCYQPAGKTCITYDGRRAHYTHTNRKRQAEESK